MSASVSEAAFWTCDCIFWNKGKTERVRWRQNVRFKQRNGRLRQRDHHLPGIACLGRRLLAPSRQDSDARVRFRAWPRHGRATRGGAKRATGGGAGPGRPGGVGPPTVTECKRSQRMNGGTTGRANIGVTQSCMEGKKSNRRTPVSQTDVVERFCCVRGSGNSRHPRRRRSKGKNEGGGPFQGATPHQEAALPSHSQNWNVGNGALSTWAGRSFTRAQTARRARAFLRGRSASSCAPRCAPRGAAHAFLPGPRTAVRRSCRASCSLHGS